MCTEQIREGLVAKIYDDGSAVSLAIVEDQAGEEARISFANPDARALQGVLAKHLPTDVDHFAKGKVTGAVFGKAFPEADMRGQAMAMAGLLAADLIANEADCRKYSRGFVDGFYEALPKKSEAEL